MKEIITITGPTAAGKTDVCLKIARDYSVEIISADSRQIYKYMDIGTGKPTSEERKVLPHHLIDILEPDEKYSAQDFYNDTVKKIELIRERDNIPVICGGTVLYIKSINEGFFSEPHIPDEVRQKARNEVENRGSQIMHEKLEEVDPKAAKNIHPNDGQRIARALEVYWASGKPITEHWKNQKHDGLNLKIFALIPEREKLYERIDKRVKKMFDNGFVDEVKKLLDLGYDTDDYAFSSIGYTEIAEALLKNENPGKTIKNIVTKTRQYATRQITFIKRLENVHRFKSGASLKRRINERLQKK